MNAIAEAHEADVRIRMTVRTRGAVTPPREFDAKLPYEELNAANRDPRWYGQLLGTTIFGEPQAKELLSEAMTHARAHSTPLRLLLVMDPASRPASLSWETLAGPDGKHLALEPNVYLTRFVEVAALPKVLEPPPTYPSALVAVASPTNLDPIPRDEHIKRATVGLRGVSMDVLSTGVTLARLQDALRTPYDLLYLICHGVNGAPGPRLWLEREDGTGHLVDVGEFLRVFGEHVPRLVILGSCSSAGQAGQPGQFMGPMLAQAGIPAVLAFNGQLASETLDTFIGEVFDELRRSGRLERAVSTARGLIRLTKWEWPQPVLHSRLTDEEILLPVREAPLPHEFSRWPMVLDGINEHRCIPVAGWDCDAGVLGQESELANALAARFHLPVHAEDVRRFWEVARILVATQGTPTTMAETAQELRRTIQRRHPHLVGTAELDGTLTDVVSRVSRVERQADQDHPLRVLAQIPAKLFFSTSWFPTLTDALRDAGKAPVVVVPRWNEQIPIKDLDQDPALEGTVGRPLVVHLAGLWNDEESLVLTDDDHLTFANALGDTPQYFVPLSSRGEAIRRTLLVCGADLSDPLIRTLLQAFTRWTHAAARNRLRHVVVHPEPSASDDAAKRRAEDFVDGYLHTFAATRYWGPVTQFARELRLKREGQNA